MPRRRRHSPRHRGGARRPWRLSISALLTSVLALAGMGLLAYPTAAAWVTQYNQSQVTGDYDAQVDRAVPDAQTQLAQAHRYNEALSAGALLEAGSTIPTGDGRGAVEGMDYRAILRVNDEGLMARLRIPAIDLDLPVYHGTDDATLLKGLGHLEGTSLPVGGPGTRSVVTGHRGLAEATMFTNLDRVTTGDTFTMEVLGEVLSYRVTEVKVVQPEETEALRAVEGRDLMTLVTCTPLGINTHRILVTGERIHPTPAEDLARAGGDPDVPGFPWWIPALVAGLVIVIVYFWRSGHAAARRHALIEQRRRQAATGASGAAGASGARRASGAGGTRGAGSADGAGRGSSIARSGPMRG